uniref:(northern house mosquito) hypothetical protein n=1 Tax=Culex pipiens TaxID=7175 RepID=A0A8D8I6N5_CULPI
MMMVVLMGFAPRVVMLVVVLVAKVIAGKFQAVTINFPTKTVIICRALAQTIAIIIMVIYFNGSPHLTPCQSVTGPRLPLICLLIIIWLLEGGTALGSWRGFYRVRF